MRIFLCCFCLFTISLAGFAQNELRPADRERLAVYEDTLVGLGTIVLTDTVAENRFAATRKLITTLVKALETPHSFRYKFPALETVSIQYPQDSSFRLFTWQLYVDKSDYRYYGAIQRPGETLDLIALSDRSADMRARELKTATLTPDNWYGFLCYKIRQFDTPTGRKYLLFGFDGFEFFDKRKLVDVLQFDAAGRASFGAPVFVREDPDAAVPHRLLFEYNAEASIRLNYDEHLDVLIHSHLIPMGNRHTGFPSNVPDGSFVGYEHGADGRWHERSKMFTTTVKDAPRDTPILDDEKGRNVNGEVITAPTKKAPKRRKRRSDKNG